MESFLLDRLSVTNHIFFDICFENNSILFFNLMVEELPTFGIF